MHGVAVNPAKLARAFSERFTVVLPPELEIAVTGAAITLADRNTGEARLVDLCWEWPEYDMCSAVEDALDAFQDEVAETLTEPWPASSPGPMPEPFAEIRGGELLAGYGDVDEPVLALDPIVLRDLA